MMRQERTEPGATAYLQLAQLSIAHLAQLLGATTRNPQLPEVEQVEEPPTDRSPRAARPSDDEVTECLDEAHHDPRGDDPQQSQPRVRREQDPYPGASQRELVGPIGVRTLLGRFAVRNPGIRRDEHPCARKTGPPAEIEVFGPGERRRIEATELAEQVGANEHRRGGDV